MEPTDFFHTFTELPADFEKGEYNVYTDPMTIGLITCAKVTYIITVIGFVLNGLSAMFMILPISYSRRSPIQMLTSRLWLTLGILIAQTIQLLLTISYMMITNPRLIHRNRFQCILVSCVPESLDFVTNLMVTLLSFNLLIVVKNSRTNSTRRFTILLLSASIAAWTMGFVLSFVMTAPFVDINSGQCIETLPLYMSLIRTFISFLVPYICSITAVSFTLKAWYGMRRRIIMQVEVSDSPDRKQAMPDRTMMAEEILVKTDNQKAGTAQHSQILATASTPSCSKRKDIRLLTTDPVKYADTNQRRDVNIEAGILATEDTQSREISNFNADLNTLYREGASKDTNLGWPNKESSDAKSIEAKQTTIEIFYAEDATKSLKKEIFSQRSLRMWIVFNTLIVIFGFLSRFLLRLPTADIFSSTTTGYYTYMCVAALLYSVYIACFPLLCFIICEVRHTFNARLCKLWLAIACWGCDCCIEINKESLTLKAPK